MNEYLMYRLWQQREKQLLRELEHQRVVEERMLEQQRERELAVAPVPAAGPDADEYVLVDE